MHPEPQLYFALTPEERIRQTEATHDQYRRVFQPICTEFNQFQQPWLVQDFIPLGGLVIHADSSATPAAEAGEVV